MRLVFTAVMLGMSVPVQPALADNAQDTPTASPADRVDVGALVAEIKRVGPKGHGNRQAMRAAGVLRQAGSDQIVEILREMKGAGPLAMNWIRGAVETARDHATARGEQLPVDQLEAFLHDTTQEPRARRMVYEWIAAADKSAPARLIPGMLDDPSLELRRDAVERVLEQGAAEKKAGKKEAALETYRRALTAARAPDQVRAASAALGELGEKPDLARHFGFVLEWKLIGPFDNTNKRGFAASHPPEEQLDFAAKYPGKVKTVAWIDHTTTHETGRVDLNEALGKNMGAVAYAAAEFHSDRARPAELRLSSTNANKVWLNGKLLHAAEIYHTGSGMDQYIGRGRLREGRNVILVKICQNEQSEDWAQGWQFQLRVCDELGTAIRASRGQGSAFRIQGKNRN